MSRHLRANPNIANPTDPTDQSEKAIDQITNSHAIPSVEATPLQIFRTIAKLLLFSERFF